MVKITVQYGEHKWVARLLTDESWSVRQFEDDAPTVAYHIPENELREEINKVVSTAINKEG